MVEADASKYTQYQFITSTTIKVLMQPQAQYNSNVYILAPSAKGLKDITEKNAKKNSSASDYTSNFICFPDDGAASSPNTR